MQGASSNRLKGRLVVFTALNIKTKREALTRFAVLAEQAEKIRSVVSLTLP